MSNLDLNAYIRRTPNFPKPGVMFYDITSLLLSPEAFSNAIERLSDACGLKTDAIAGIEARGFIFGAALAYRLKKPFIPIRKKGKLPGETLGSSYALEYGESSIEVHKSDIPLGKNVLIVDDLLATGGTIKAAIDILTRGGAVVTDVCALIGLTFLPYKSVLTDINVTTLLEYDNE